MSGSSMKLSSCGVYSKRRFASFPPEYGTPLSPSMYPLAFFSVTSLSNIFWASVRVTGAAVLVPVCKVEPRRPYWKLTE